MDFDLITKLAQLAQDMGVRVIQAFPAVPTASGGLRLWLEFGRGNGLRYIFYMRKTGEEYE